ncbi:hypothetical protein LSH36_122g05012 [Paralvinella palmiformis]|uniref:RING-type domain-containing protein n=1 Tax=Paralvinella palmiformis TaxID=53620 RepID=A0AAD9JX74_9ANNE|nr:hypothetical protein LSH36_122g05012 [Paralvinella palmiformis]
MAEVSYKQTVAAGSVRFRPRSRTEIDSLRNLGASSTDGAISKHGIPTNGVEYSVLCVLDLDDSVLDTRCTTSGGNRVDRHAHLSVPDLSINYRLPQMKRSQNVRVSELNPHLMCVLCGGYYVDATTIIECLHSFCKTCIVRYLDSSKFCPICDVQVHKTKPLLNIRPDYTLQKLVYKLVPGLFTREVLKRREFYRQNPGSPSSSCSEAGNSADGADDPLISGHHVVPDDKMSISLEFSVDGKAVQSKKSKGKGKNTISGETILQKRYLLCPASFTIGHVKKFIRMKLDLSPMLEVDVFHVDEPLSDSYALLDIAHIYNWTKHEPFPLYFSVFENSAKRQKCEDQNDHVTTEPLPEADNEANSGSSSDVGQTERISSKSTYVADDVNSGASVKSVKRKLEDELSAVADAQKTSSGNVSDDVKAISDEDIEDRGTVAEDEAEDEVYDEDADGQLNGCKISTSSSGKSIVVSIPKHLLENSGSEKEKKKKKNKRRDSHRHHRHHRKHKHQSRDGDEDDGQGSRSKKRKQSSEECPTGDDRYSSVSGSPPSEVNTPSEVHDAVLDLDDMCAKDSDNGSTTIVASDETDSGERSGEKSAPSSATSDLKQAIPVDRIGMSAKPEHDSPRDRKLDMEPAERKQPSREKGQRDSEKVIIGNTMIHREPVLHQLEEEWKRQKMMAEGQSRTNTENETQTISGSKRMNDGGQSSNTIVESVDDNNKKTSTRESTLQQKKPSTQKIQLKRTVSKPKLDPQTKSQTVKQKLQIVSDAMAKQKQAKERANKSNHGQSSEVNEPKSKPRRDEKTPSREDNGKKSCQQSESDNKRSPDIAEIERSQRMRQETSSSRKQPTLEENEKITCQQKGAEREKESDKQSRGVESSNSSSPSTSTSEKCQRNSTNSNSKGQTNDASHFLDRVKEKVKEKRTELSSEKNHHKDRESLSPSTTISSSPVSIRPVSGSTTTSSVDLPRKSEISPSKESSAVRRTPTSPRLTGPAPISRPDTLNVPIPWKSLSSLAKAGRKVQESANNALGRNSSCGSSARMLGQTRPDDPRNPNGLQSATRLSLDRRDNAVSKSSSSSSPFPETLSAFESPTMPKGIKTYSKKDKLLYKSQTLFTSPPFTFKAFLGDPDDQLLGHRTAATGSTSAFLSSTLLSVSRKEKTHVSGSPRQIHGHKVIGQLNMVYETIQKPSYSEVCRKSSTTRQPSPIKHQPSPTFGKVNGEQKNSPVADSGSTGNELCSPKEERTQEESVIRNDKDPELSGISEDSQSWRDKSRVNNTGNTSISTEKQQQQPNVNNNNSRTSQTKVEPSSQYPEGEASTEPIGSGSTETVDSGSTEAAKMAPPPPTSSQVDYSRCNSSFSATHLPTSPPRYSHRCGASSPTEALCLKCSPRPRSTSPHVTSGGSHSLQRALSTPATMSCHRERSHSTSMGCPRAAHTGAHAGAHAGSHSPQNNNLSAALSIDQNTIRCDQCQSAPVATPNNAQPYDKMALQEVPLDLHKPRTRPDP